MYRHLKSNPKASFVQGRHSFGSRSCTLVTCCRWLICLHSLFLGCACSGFELTHQHVKHGPHYKATSNFIHERWSLSSRSLLSFSWPAALHTFTRPFNSSQNPLRRQSRLRDLPGQIGLSECHGGLSWLPADVGTSPRWAAPLPGQMVLGCLRERESAGENTLHSSKVSALTSLNEEL